MKVRHARLDIAEKQLDPQPSDRILSVGCRRGELERSLVPKVHSVTACDIENISENERPLEVDGIQFFLGDITKGLPFEDAHFDKVLFLEVLEHVPSGLEYPALKEIFRVLKPGGKLIFSTPHWHPVACAFDPAYWLQGHRHYTVETIENLVRSVGFSIEEQGVYGAWKEAVLIPVYYVALRIKLGNIGHNIIHRGINSEYPKPGWYTISMSLRKSA